MIRRLRFLVKLPFAIFADISGASVLAESHRRATVRPVVEVAP